MQTHLHISLTLLSLQLIPLCKTTARAQTRRFSLGLPAERVAGPHRGAVTWSPGRERAAGLLDPGS